MTQLEADYLVVGAGASGMAFVDSLLSLTDARVVLVDRQERPGGHWRHAYPFVRLHQPSANYGVASRPLGSDRIDETGPNAGYYERATAQEICEHFGAALDDLVASGRVTFLAETDYLGSDGDGHHLRSLRTGADTTVHATTLVDATYVESSDIPSRHTPAFTVDDGVRLIPPNDLVDLGETPTGFTVLGSGKTAMDTVAWLLDSGVDPGQVRWVRPRDCWMFDRGVMQPLEQVASYMRMQAQWVAEATKEKDDTNLAHRLASDGALVRIDPDVEPTMFRGAIISPRELELFRTVDDVVRMGKVQRLGGDRIELADGSVPARPGEVYIDCTAYGISSRPPRAVFEPGRITLAYITIGITPYGAATIAAVEAQGKSEQEKNQLCPPMTWTGRTADVLDIAHAGMQGIMARAMHPEVGTWNEACRLNPAAGAAAKAADDPEIADAFMTMATHIGDALSNLEQRAGTSNRIPEARAAEAAAPTA
jgi:hypothetical protein